MSYHLDLKSCFATLEDIESSLLLFFSRLEHMKDEKEMKKALRLVGEVKTDVGFHVNRSNQHNERLKD